MTANPARASSRSEIVVIAACSAALVCLYLLVSTHTPAESWQQDVVAGLWVSLGGIALAAGIVGRRGRRWVFVLGLGIFLFSVLAYVPLLHNDFQTARLDKRMKLRQNNQPAGTNVPGGSNRQ